MAFDQKLTLENINQGKLAKQFNQLYPTLISSLKEGDKASVTIKIEFARAKGTDTMVGVTTSIAHTVPVRKLSGICQLNDSHELLTDKVPEPESENLKLFEIKKEATK